VLQQEPDRRVHRLGLDHVVVVEDQQRLIITKPARKLVDEGRHRPLERMRRGRAEQVVDPLTDTWAHPIQSRGSVTPKSCGVIVTRIQRQPPSRPTFPRIQSASNAVLPKPAGADTKISAPASPSPSVSAKRGRATRPGGGRGTYSLVASRTSCPVGATPAGAVVRSTIGNPPLTAASDPPFRRWIRHLKTGVSSTAMASSGRGSRSRQPATAAAPTSVAGAAQARFRVCLANGVSGIWEGQGCNTT
jgi:hypothetical protein